jgi:hypothetical protein
MGSRVELEVLNPAGEPVKMDTILAPRPQTLEGKNIGLISNGKPSGEELLNEIGNLLKERYPTAQTVFRKISFTSRKLPPGELEAIANDIDIGVFASGD